MWLLLGYTTCLVAIITLVSLSPAGIVSLICGIILVIGLFFCIKSLVVDKKNLTTICDFYQKAHRLDDLVLIKDERPYRKILDIVVTLGQFDWAVLFLMDFDNDKFVAVESSGIALKGFSPISFDEIATPQKLGNMNLSLKLLEHAFKTYELKGALAGSTLEKNAAYYGCLLVGRNDPDASLNDADNLRLNVLSDQISICLHNYKLHQELSFRAKQLTEKQEQLNRELNMAKKIQDTALTLESPEFEGLETACFVKPARFVGGDFLKFFPDRKNRRMYLLIGDVCGKGMPAALVMAVTLSLFQEKREMHEDPAEVMSEVNIALKKFLGDESKFNSTAIFGYFDMHNKKFTYASAGHDFPLLLKARNKQIEELASTGTLLGIFEDSCFKSRVLNIEKEDKLIFYSDGLIDMIEALYDSEDGFPVLKKIFIQKASLSPEEMVEFVAKMVEQRGPKQKDDISVTVVKIS
jgi:serine phosphatase RsbU (regulator of sigma subunit)